MSRSVRYDWKVRDEQRRREYLDRVRNTTARFLARYRDVLNDLARQELNRYVVDDFDRLNERLSEAETQLSIDPERARDVSMGIGMEISRLPAQARSARRELQERQRRQEQELVALRSKAGADVNEALRNAIADVADPVERDFAFDELRQLSDRYLPGPVDPADVSRIQDELRVRLKEIKEGAAIKAREWKLRRADESQREAAAAMIELHSTELAADSALGSEAAQRILGDLNTLRVQLDNGAASIEQISRGVSELMEQANESAVTENCRRVVVRAVIEALRGAGFEPAAPRRYQEGNVDEVVIVARKPNGHEAQFRIGDMGTMAYKFARYEGAQCKADIDKVVPLLQQVYGISLSNERVEWVNPDRMLKTARPAEGPDMERKHGR